MKKQVCGVAGAARIKNIDRAGLARAEKHGKRLDKTGKARAINDVPPVTTTGLDLQALYEKHVEGAFVPKAKSSAMHLLIQFPTDLVDGADADYMLRHARGFAERVFGDKAIFADRVDRDEQSQRVVDLFLAPRYMKTTKHESKPATSTTYHLKMLADAHGEKPLPFGYGRALQTAFFEYMRDVMQLEGVERGRAKAVPGQDWKSAEQQRAEELDDLHAQANTRLERIEREQAVAQADRIAAAEARAAAEAELQSLAGDRHILDRDRADVARRSTELARRERELQVVEDALRAARADVQRQQDDLAIELATAARATEIAREKAIVTVKATAAAEANRDAAARATAQADAEVAAIAAERAMREAELALLLKASDDANGLDLRSAGADVTMNDTEMDDAERSTFQRPWPAPVRALALTLAKVLERVRELTRSLLDRETSVAAKEAAVTLREHQLENDRVAQRARHEQALAALALREEAVKDRAADAARAAAVADARLAMATETQNAAKSATALAEHWAKAVDLVGRYPTILIHDDRGGFRLDTRPGRTGGLPAWLVTTLQQPPPSWAKAAITGFHRLELMTERVETRERDAEQHLERLQEMIDEAGPALRPAQQAVAEEAKRAIRQIGGAIRQYRDQGPGM